MRHSFAHSHICTLTLRLRHQFLTLFNSFVDSTDVEESLFGQVVHLTIKYHVEAADNLLDGYHYARNAGKLLSHGERLALETLYTACTVDGQAILIREFVHTQNGDDVLQFLILL